MSIEKIERQLRDGLEGVTAGEWKAGSGWVFIDPKDGYQTSPLRHILRDVPGDEIQANGLPSCREAIDAEMKRIDAARALSEREGQDG